MHDYRQGPYCLLAVLITYSGRSGRDKAVGRWRGGGMKGEYLSGRLSTLSLLPSFLNGLIQIESIIVKGTVVGFYQVGLEENEKYEPRSYQLLSHGKRTCFAEIRQSRRFSGRNYKSHFG